MLHLFAEITYVTLKLTVLLTLNQQRGLHVPVEQLACKQHAIRQLLHSDRRAQESTGEASHCYRSISNSDTDRDHGVGTSDV